MSKLSSQDWLGIASVLLLLILTAVDNAYIMFAVYGIALVSGALIIFRKMLTKLEQC
ncbi:hypothetical protein Tfer_3285 [Thermincola ferriacetica]|uniref:Uncharacterized protein n=1 Tax=Thermincola ferriacetica TaxID=281456 RepID=A0A0L6VYF4_9FIRM|nr:hypothetical protein [Thermincola ferriacetica]KNZ68183.1 hypothetical protein Tfer_3285 [Thermincola ferriacetica]